MFLTARPLKNVQSVNSFEYSTEFKLRQGNPSTIYFQLCDADQLDANGNPLRYMPASGATMSATFSSVVSSYSVTKTGTQPFSQDTSIWSINILSTDRLATGNFVFIILENGISKSACIDSAIIVQTDSPSYC